MNEALLAKAGSADAGAQDHSVPAVVPGTVTYSCSPGLGAFLSSLNAAIAISSYQSGKLYLIGGKPNGGLSVHERFFRKAMGIYTAPNTIVLAYLNRDIRLNAGVYSNLRLIA